MIIVNDGSTDGCEKILAEFTDPRIRLINQKNSGVSATRNTGWQNSTSSYVSFLDADDEWNQDFLKYINLLLLKYPDVAAYATHIKENKQSQVQHFSFYESQDEDAWIIQNYFDCLNKGYYPVHSSAICVKRDILIEIKGFNEILAIGEDIDTWIRIFLNYEIVLSNWYDATYHLDALNHSTGSGISRCGSLNFYRLA